MGKELDQKIAQCRRYIFLMKDEVTEVGAYVKQAKPVFAKCESLLSDYIKQIYGDQKDPKKAEKTWKEFVKLVKMGDSAMSSIIDMRIQLEQDSRGLDRALDKLRKHVQLREKKSLFRSKSNTKDAQGLIKAYSQFLSHAQIATDGAFKLSLEFSSLKGRFLKGVA